MAIVNKLSTLRRDPANASSKTPDPFATAGRLRQATGSVANLASDNTGSKYFLATVPGYAYLDPATSFQVSTWGFADIRIGTEGIVGGLVSALRSAAATQSPAVAFDANHEVELWQRLGLTTRTVGPIDIYAHGIANATGAGSMKFLIRWIDN